MQVSVIIPSYNRCEALHLTLKSLTKQKMPWDAYEIIVVDDGSEDGSSDMVNNFQTVSSMQWLEQVHKGPSAARNRGAAQARAGLLVFLDGDMLADECLLEEYQALHKANPQALIIGRQLPYPPVYDPQMLISYYYSFVSDQGPKSFNPAFHALASGNFAIAKNSFERLGGFDEGFLMAEDVELGYRANQLGIPILYHPRALSYHNHPKTLELIYSQSRNSGWWTAQLMRKHPQIRGQIPIYNLLEEPSLCDDPFGLQLQRMEFYFFSTPVGLWFLKLIQKIAVKATHHAHFLGMIHYRILMGNLRIGYYRGLNGKPARD